MSPNAILLTAPQQAVSLLLKLLAVSCLMHELYCFLLKLHFKHNTHVK